jgi:hypothetical protein
VQLIARALGLDCLSFVDPALVLPEDKPTARGRPRKPAEAAPVPKKGK